MLRWIEKNYDYISNIVSAVTSVALSLLSTYLYESFKGDGAATAADKYILVTLVIFSLALVVVVSWGLRAVKKCIFKDEDLNKYIQKAYLSIQDLSLESQSCLQELGKNQLDKWAFQNIQLAVDKCYEFLWSSFGGGKILIEETKFEVTYMTLSYKDRKITIPCSCNREKRTPNSMLLRAKDPDIYRKTVTAQIYAEYEHHSKPTFRIIEDTAQTLKCGLSYQFIYENQNERIKSSVVLPVMSHRNELLGTLVVHCNRPGFFKEKQRAFWYEILQLFASEIGKNKMLLDNVRKEGSEPF